jgi:hypothetical protein
MKGIILFSFRLPLLLFLLVFILPPGVTAYGQDSSADKVVVFPSPMKTVKWRSSIGFSFLTTPEAIAEEARLRVPAGELIVLRKISDHFNLEGQLTFQVLQNHISLGARWTQQLTDKIYLGIGDNLGYWFGFLPVNGFDSKAHGWVDYFYASLGYRLKKDVWLSFKAESSFNIFFKAANGHNVISQDKNFYNGEAFTFSIEQPFFHKKHISLSISGIYNNFYWQTWSLFYLVDRKVFYPQFKVGFIL